MATETATEVEKPTEPSPETASSLVPGLKFPPKNDQINYMVQIGNFSPEEAGKLGKQLMQADPSLQGRIFRTSTGKLYAGYFYRMEDAREALDRISRQIPYSGDAMVKTIRF
ncbi:hypothetical protein LPTSP4_23150 [Leptospira ryugenii]|uniref:Uncharacterized protein n=2 Tax=Leptospira ryugenii TaxID=1917863 RepID=A0A2P2E1M2_9LEPT|nr:hypothetical protein LPTSP4_23150 [Leptospira ryugenii]